jgi:hypothetical protein
MRYYVLCMRISNISIYVRTEMCTNNKFVSTLICKRFFHTDMKTSRSIVCQTNMHLIMWIENAFKFCDKLIRFYNEWISFLFLLWRWQTWGCQLTFIKCCGSQADLLFTWCLQVSVVPMTVLWFLSETPWGFSAFLLL